MKLRATDRVGNQTHVDARWRVDVEPPSLSLRTPDGQEHPPGMTVQMTVGDKVSVTAIDDDSGVEQLRYGDYQRTFSMKGTFQFMSPGRHLFRAEAEDAMGNIASAEWLLVIATEGRD